MQLTDQPGGRLSQEFPEIFWRDAVTCAWCSQSASNKLQFSKDFRCNSCGSQFEIRGNELRWRQSDCRVESIDTLPQRRMSISRALDLLSRALNPLSSPLSPFRYLSNFRIRQYYKRTVLDGKLAEQWANHYFSGLELPINAAVLDHGCGKGRHVGLLTQLGFDVCAQDIAPSNWWRHFPVCKFQIVPASAPRLPWPDASFDLVLNVGVLGLLPRESITEFTKEVRRVLKPNGYWLILEANDKSYGRHGFQQTTLPLDAARLVSRETGFNEIDVSYEGFYSPVFPLWVNFFRKVCVPWRINLADFDSSVARLIPSEKRGLWLLRLQRD